LLPWQLFSSALSEAGNSLVSNANMISKVYFPRLIVPVSTTIVTCVDFLLSLLVLAALMMWYGFMSSLRILTLPMFLILALAGALGAGIWTAALNVKYRDVRFIVPFVVQLGLYISPVGFSSAVVPEEWRLIYSLNPMVGVIDGFRWALLDGNAQLNWSSLLASLAVTVVVLVSGLIHFRRTEKTFVDVI
jgi:lipopolysaccharide transport system permease protein